MAVVQLIDPGRQARFTELQARLFEYTGRVEELRSPDEVLNQLDAITKPELSLSVFFAMRFPMKSGDWEFVQLGKSAFLHKDVPEGMWEEYHTHAPGKFRPVLFLAASSMASHTWTEVRRMLQPIGIDKWTFEFFLKHGMRDGLTCSICGRWVVGFWSHKELSNILTRPVRIMIYAAASFAALRLEQLVDLDPNMVGSHTLLTPRELAVLRLVSTGAPLREVAQALEIGEETVRSHMKKAQSKLGVRNRTQAVAEALRQDLIP